MPNWFWLVVVILLVLWLLGLVTNVFGGLIHILLIVVLILAIVWFVQRIKAK